MRLTTRLGLCLTLLAGPALAQEFIIAELQVDAPYDEGELPDAVWKEVVEHLPGFTLDKTYRPILMSPSPYKGLDEVLDPEKYSYVVRGTVVSGAPVIPIVCDNYTLVGTNGFSQAKACTTRIRTTVETYSGSPEPIPDLNADPGFGPGGGGCSESYTPICVGGTCPAEAGGDCGQNPWALGDPCSEVGDVATVRALQGVDALHGLGLRGQGVIIGIVDGGIDDSDGPVGLSNLLRASDPEGELYGLADGEKVVIGGWPTEGDNMWGTPFTGAVVTPWFDHGPMTATNALAMAPAARIYDMRINSPCPSEFCTDDGCGRLSDALAAYDWALSLPPDERPDILSNSWGIFREEDAPDYVGNREHWFNRKVDEAVAAGIIVVFAAGNTGSDLIFCAPCGGDEPFEKGGAILGANGHPDVLTVGGVNVHEEYIAYSTSGGDYSGGSVSIVGTKPPGLFNGTDDAFKPDIVSPSHTSAYWNGVRGALSFVSSDAGTSTSCANAAGQVALLRQAHPTATPAEIKDAIKRSAKSMGPKHLDLPWGDYNYYTGFGRMQTYEALRELVVTCGSALTTPAPTVSLFGGGTQTLGLCAGPENAGKLYLMLGSSCLAGESGCIGLPTPVGTTPLGYSSYLQWTLDHPNNFIIPKSVGFLDDEGHAVSSFTIPPLPLSGSLLDASLYHGFSVVSVDNLFSPTFLSNAVAVTFGL